MLENPIFIVGSERSGSDLLRLMLNEHSNIAIPHPPHLMKDLSPILPKYGDLTKNYPALVRDAVKLVDLHFAPWPIKIDSAKLWQLPHRDLYCVYAGVYEQYLEHSGKARWGCKSTFMIHHIREILAHHKEPKFIHLVRDPRDVAIAAKKSVFNHFHPYYIAKLWQKEQRLALRWRQDLKNNWLTVRYEDLISNPETKLKEICLFLNEPFEGQMLKYAESNSAKELARLSKSWSNLSKPISPSTPSYINMEQKDLHLIESICKEEMAKFSYFPLHKYFLDSKPLDRVQYFMLEKLQKFKIELGAIVQDRNAILRMKKRFFLKRRKWIPFKANE